MTESARLVRSPAPARDLDPEAILRRAREPRSTFRLRLETVDGMPVLVDADTGTRLEGVREIEVAASDKRLNAVEVRLSLVLFAGGRDEPVS